MVDAGVPREFTVATVCVIPSGHHEKFDLQLSRAHVGISAASIRRSLKGSQHRLNQRRSMSPLADEQANVQFASQDCRQKSIRQQRPPDRSVGRNDTFVADGRSRARTRKKTNRRKIHYANADRFLRIIYGVNKPFPIRGAPFSQNLLRASGKENATLLS